MHLLAALFGLMQMVPHTNVIYAEFSYTQKHTCNNWRILQPANLLLKHPLKASQSNTTSCGVTTTSQNMHFKWSQQNLVAPF